jgi:hypothetical protein
MKPNMQDKIFLLNMVWQEEVDSFNIKHTDSFVANFKTQITYEDYTFWDVMQCSLVDRVML